MHKGYTQVSRNVVKEKWYRSKRNDTMGVLLEVMLTANHSNDQIVYMGAILEKNEARITLNQLSINLGITIKQVRLSLVALEQTGYIKCKVADNKKYTIVWFDESKHAKSWVKIYRSYRDNDIYSRKNQRRLFTHLLLRADYQEKSRGMLIASRKQLSNVIGLSAKQIRTATTKLVNVGTIKTYVKNITQEKYSKKLGTAFSVVNYDNFQNSEKAKFYQANKNTNGNVVRNYDYQMAGKEILSMKKEMQQNAKPGEDIYRPVPVSNINNRIKEQARQLVSSCKDITVEETERFNQKFAEHCAKKEALHLSEMRS